MHPVQHISSRTTTTRNCATTPRHIRLGQTGPSQARRTGANAIPLKPREPQDVVARQEKKKVQSPSTKRPIKKSKAPQLVVTARSRWSGFTPCEQCDMLLPTQITTAQLVAHRASMPHRLAIALPGRPADVLARSAERVEDLRRKAERRRERARRLLSTLGHGGPSQGRDHSVAGASGARVGDAATTDDLLALTRQTNRGFVLLEKLGWEAGIGIGRREWRRLRKLKKSEKRAHDARANSVAAAVGRMRVGDRDVDETEVEAAVGGSRVAEGRESAVASARRDKHRGKRPDQLAERYRHGGNTVECAIALSDSDDDDAQADVSGHSAHGFLDFHFDSSDDEVTWSDVEGRGGRARGKARSHQLDGRSGAKVESDHGGSDSEADVEWLGLETKRRKGEGVHAFLLRKFDTTERAKRVDAGKRRKRGLVAGGRTAANADDDDDSDWDDEEDEEGQPGEENEALANGDALGSAAPEGSSGGVPIPAVNKKPGLEPLALSLKMQHALDRSGVGASSAFRTPIGKLGRVGGTLDVMGHYRPHTRSARNHTKHRHIYHRY
ncbi:hypothetical protein V8E36_001515 [Tilletia maclaganii]